MTRLTFIPAQFVKVVQATRADLTAFVVAGIYIDEGKPGVARAWKVGADGSDGGEIEFTNEGGKDDTVSAAILPDGSVRLVVSEAAPGASGSTAQPSVYLIPAVFPAAPTVTAVDQAARNQANAATNMAHSAINQNTVQDGQIAALTAAIE